MSATVRFTVAEYDRMIEQQVFDGSRDRRMELIYGEMREMTPPSPPHEDTIDLLAHWSFAQTDRNEVRVRVQNSIGIPALDSVALPDVTWVRQQSYRTGRPQPSDVLLLIEVAGTTLAYDRGDKARLYATAGIADYWIVNLREQCIEVYRQPHSGDYREKQTFEIADSVSPLALPTAALAVSSLFGP